MPSISPEKLSQAEFPEAAKELQQHVYLDDIGSSRETATKAKLIIHQPHWRAILEKAHLQIKTWMILAAPEKQQPKQSWLYTNHIDALSSRKLTCRSKRGLPIRRNWVDQSIGNGERFTDLYQRWHKQTDKFTFKKNEFNELRVLTERRCLGLIGQLWDPIGPCVARSNQAQNRPKRIVELRL